jgi:hypothetical protein
MYRAPDGTTSLARDFWGPPRGLRLLDATTGEFSTALSELNLVGLLGWRGDEMLINGGDSVVAMPFGGTPRLLARLRPGNDHHIADLQLASGLTGQLQVVDDPGVDRGPWPVELRIAVVAAVALVAAAVTVVIRRRTRRTDP